MVSNGRGLAPALATIAALATLFAGACSSHRETMAVNRAAGGADPAAPAAARGASAVPAELTGVTLVTDGDGPRLLISGSQPLTPTIYTRDDGRKVVVDLPDTVATAGLEPPRVPAGAASLSSVQMRSFTELGRPHVQFEMEAEKALDPRLAGEAAGGSATAILLASRDSESAAARPAEAVASAATAAATAATAAPVATAEPVVPAPSTSEPVPQPVRLEAPPAVVDASAPTPAATPASDRLGLVRREATGRRASRLTGVVARSSGGNAVVRLAADGNFTYEAFLLSNPPRYVVDLEGVRNASGTKSQEVRGGSVTRVRVSQFRTEPEAVTRVVFDLEDASQPSLVAGEKSLKIEFRPAAAVVAASAPAPTAVRIEPTPAVVVASAVPASGSYERHEAEDPAERVVGPGAPAGAPAPVETAAKGPASPPSVPAAVEAAPAAAPVPAAAPKPQSPVASPVPAPLAAPPVPEIVAVASPEIRSVPAPVPPPAKASPKPAARRRVPTSEDKALVEAAEALLSPQDKGTKDLSNPYEARTVGAGEKQYTGEPISLNLKDADVKDTLQKFAELTGLNIVLDPEVRGTVTISLNDVPWDQALELILRVNGLGYAFEGNVMRIATTTKLTSEEQNRLALSKAQENSRPVKTIIQKLSYAQGSRLVPAIQKVMTPRGDVYFDQRSNSLIIKELPENIPVILDLIKNLDLPPQQVMIEARIIEATRTFSKSLGVAWGYNTVFDAAHGNTTGLVFPNNGQINGGLSLGTNTIGSPANIFNIALGNVLDTLKLEFALNAAEARGLVKTISNPKVQTTQLVQASIQSGVQVPVQTTVNNTTTVLYIDATIRLDVLPYITAEGTVVLDIKVQKREPLPGINIASGNNVPLQTRDAQTTLLVRDGGTAVIGGIMKMKINNQKNMVPGLWKIPLLGNLFQNYSDSDETDELMIFITPRIMKSN